MTWLDFGGQGQGHSRPSRCWRHLLVFQIFVPFPIHLWTQRNTA